MKKALLLHDLSDLIKRHAGAGAGAGAGAAATVAGILPGVMLLRADGPSASVSVIAEPMLCLVAQGAKRIVMGERVLEFGPANSLVVSMAMPVASEVVLASPDHPYLAVGFPLDTTAIAELLLDLPQRGAASESLAIDLQSAQTDLLDVAVRTLRLLDNPGDLHVLGPLLARELLYRLMTGHHASNLIDLAQAQNPKAKVARAAAWIRHHHARPLRIAEVAALVAMSESALHRNFKAYTGMSPLNYQKQIRLQEARARLLVGSGEVADIGFAVGYNSPSQFSREYVRMFGRPPGRDTAQLRAESAFPGAAPATAIGI